MLLLDTSVLLWSLMRSQKIRPAVLERLEDGSVQIYVSTASIWEISIKHAIGRLELPGDPSLYLPKRMADAGFLALPISIGHALAVSKLPRIHDDPFDRMLVAQAQIEGLTLVTSDKHIVKYDVRSLVV